MHKSVAAFVCLTSGGSRGTLGVFSQAVFLFSTRHVVSYEEVLPWQQPFLGEAVTCPEW